MASKARGDDESLFSWLSALGGMTSRATGDCVSADDPSEADDPLDGLTYRPRVSQYAAARASCAAATSAYPTFQGIPPLRIAVMMSGPTAAPMPNAACIQFNTRGPWAMAA